MGTSTIATNERMAATERPRVPRSQFDLTHNYTTTMSINHVFPILHEEVLPGDVFNISISWVSRLLTPLTPLMDNVFVEVHGFFAPNRLLWDNWEKFMHADYDPTAPVEYLIPVVDHSVLQHVTDTFTYLKYWPDFPWVNATSTSNTDNPVNALPFRGVSLIYNDWFRDEDLQDKLPLDTGDGPDVGTAGGNMEIFKTAPAFWRAKRKDYFTTARPWPQKGPDVLLPLLGSAPVYTDSGSTSPLGIISTTQSNLLKRMDTSGPQLLMTTVTEATPANALKADLSMSSSATLADFREAAVLQQMYERDARVGTRYTELLVGHFGVQAEDFRLQRPEYLGMARARLGYQSVTQTSETGTTPQGNLTATAASVTTNNRITKSFSEHGQFYLFASVVHDQTYQQGLPRKYRRRTRNDFYFPLMANLSEQAVNRSEIYYLGDGGTSDDVAFGYIGRWDEYRWKESRLGGVMRSADPLTLDSWSLAYDFGSAPSLNDAFIREDMPLARTIAVDSEDQMLLNFNFMFQATRPLPVRSVPGLWRI